MTQQNPVQAEKIVQLYRSLKDMSGVLQEVAAVRPELLVRQAPQYIQSLQQVAQRANIPLTNQLVSSTTTILKSLHAHQMKRAINNIIKPTIPVSVSWDLVPAATAGAQATVKSPYSGQAFRLVETLCTAGAPFRFVLFNVGGVDFAEPSRTRVDYGAGAGVPVAATRGIDFPQIKARDMNCCPETQWVPWTKVNFTSDATIDLTPYNYGAVAGSVILTLLLRSNPCGAQYKAAMLVPMAQQAQRNAIASANYLGSISEEDMFEGWN